MRELPFYISRFSIFVLRILHLSQPPEIGVSSIIDAALAPPVSFTYTSLNLEIITLKTITMLHFLGHAHIKTINMFDKGIDLIDNKPD